MAKTGSPEQDKPAKKKPVSKKIDVPKEVASHPLASRGTRETIESIVIAIILAFLFRGFEAEAFVIPTGSMATTLKGRHLDVECTQCGKRYQTGTSSEQRQQPALDKNDDPVLDKNGRVVPYVTFAATCPICQYTMLVDYAGDPNQRSFTGDRILVNKFAYDLAEPERWDIIVFKFPGNAKQNYIKRLVGLPNETLMIKHGDVYTLKREDLLRYQKEGLTYDEIVKKFQIARKPPHKIKAMLQMVDDSHYIAQALKDIHWKSRWQPWSPRGKQSAEVRSCAKDAEGFSLSDDSNQETWLRYHHYVPTSKQWSEIMKTDSSPQPNERLITDFYAYNIVNDNVVEEPKNTHLSLRSDVPTNAGFNPPSPRDDKMGTNWVGDLALECRVDVEESNSGELLLDLIEGGVRYLCRIELQSGNASLSIEGGESASAEFIDSEGKPATNPLISVKPVINGKGSYRLRFANIDNELRLWVNERVVNFDGPTTYKPSGEAIPAIRPGDGPSDLRPAGIGARNTSLKISQLRILRDIYYIAFENNSDLEHSSFPISTVREILDNPLRVDDPSLLFRARQQIFCPKRIQVNNQLQFESFKPDHFFPMGDNSPASRDARMWSDSTNPAYKDFKTPPYVDRKLLTGKAVVIYWPHSWRPFWPNFKRMGLIR